MVESGQIRPFIIQKHFDLDKMREEVRNYTDVLLAREDPPMNFGILTMMELADVYGARAREMEMEIQDAEAQGVVLRGSKAYRFRTGMLRTFIELADHASSLGSRRLTALDMEGR